jgi:hypothetical protein
MGRLVKHLDRLGLADDTILIYTTDNGTGDGVIILNDGLADCSKGQVEFGLNIGSGTLILNGGSFKALGFVGSNKGRIELNGGILEVGSLTLGAVTMDITPLPCFCPIPSE